MPTNPGIDISEVIEIDLIRLDQFPIAAVLNKLATGFHLRILLSPPPPYEAIGRTHVRLFSRLVNEVGLHLAKERITTGLLSLNFSPAVADVDISLVGVIALFRPSYPGVQFEVGFPMEASAEVFSRFRDLFLPLRDWYLYQTGVELYTIRGEDRFDKEKLHEPHGLLPVLLIGPETFQRTFVATLGSWSLSDLLKEVPTTELVAELKKQYEDHYISDITVSEKNYRVIRDTVRSFQHRISWVNVDRVYCEQYFRMLSKLDLLMEDLWQVKGLHERDFNFESFRPSGLDIVEMRALKKSMRGIQIDLLRQPPFFILIFSLLMNRQIARPEDGLMEYQRRIRGLFEFTRNLFNGITELARNMIDHTPTQRGIICGRVYIGSRLFAIEGSAGPQHLDSHFEAYIQELDRLKLLGKDPGTASFLDLTLFDEGKDGIVGTTIEKLENLENGSTIPHQEIADDLKGLKAGLILFEDFFDPRDIKLHLHAMRSAAHWGLLSFAHTITRNKGFMTAASRNAFDPSQTDICYSSFVGTGAIKPNLAGYVPGTRYSIVFPTDNSEGIESPVLRNIAPKSAGFSAENYYQLLEYRYLNDPLTLKKKDDQVLVRFDMKKFWPENPGSGYREELTVAGKVADLVRRLTPLTEKFVPVLDFDGIEDQLDNNRLLRLLGQLQLQIDIHSLIVVNIPIAMIIRLLESLDLWKNSEGQRPFWQQDHFVLIYSYELDKKRNRIYYTDVIGGKTYGEMITLKSKLASTHSTVFFNPREKEATALSPETIGGLTRSPLFINGNGLVQHFEMIITHGNKTLFEWSLSNILHTNLEEDQHGFAGYKISNTHFRLGSKTHIQDFIYAKRIFQNSFFTDRFAFLVSRYYLQHFRSLTPLTILGYGDYSQLLINRVEKILGKVLHGKKINHNMVSDMDHPFLIKDDDLLDHVLVIVPINTTLSTSVKVENFARSKMKAGGQLVPKSLNLILVSHDNLDNPDYANALNEYLHSEDADQSTRFPYKLFNWKNIDTFAKEVSIGTNQDTDDRRLQKYFLSVSSVWYSPDTCPSCFPAYDADKNGNGLYEEKPLLETDKSSVTPDLLLELPRGFQTDPKEPKPTTFLNEASHLYQHSLYKSNHHLHFIKPASFFLQYEPLIEKWAEDCQSSLEKAIPGIFSASVLLISPSERNNTYFVELINRLVFGDGAVIINYEVAGDYMENYQKFFSGNILQSQYIFYVDDFIQSGKTFHLVNDFVRYCKMQVPLAGSSSRPACDGVFTMISKTDNFSKSDIIAQLNDLPKPSQQESVHSAPISKEQTLYRAFHYLYIEAITTERCPLCAEQKRYKLLAEHSMLDITRHYFLNKALNLQPRDVQEDPVYQQGWTKFHPLMDTFKNFPWKENAAPRIKAYYETYTKGRFPGRSYIKLLVHHEMNWLLSNDDAIRDELNDDYEMVKGRPKERLVQELFDHIFTKINESPGITWLYRDMNNPSRELLSSIVREICLKVLSMPPFSNIKCVREKTFIFLLIELDKALTEYVLQKKNHFQEFRYVKFLLRRATAIGSNYVIRGITLNKIRDMYRMYPQGQRSNKEESRKVKIEELVRLEAELETSLSSIMAERDGLQNGMQSAEDLFSKAALDTKLDSINQRLSAVQHQINYIRQCVSNIYYVDRTIQEFSQFYVSLVKETTFNNDSKALRLERNLDRLLESVNPEEEKEFYYLLCMLRYENALIVKKGIELIIQELLPEMADIQFGSRFSLAATRQKLDSLLGKALDDYRLMPLKNYFQIREYPVWKKENPELHLRLQELIYLVAVLSLDEEAPHEAGGERELENKTKTILQNFFRIIGDGDFHSHNIPSNDTIRYYENKAAGAFLALRYRSGNEPYITPSRIVISHATKPYSLDKDYEMPNFKVDQQSLSYFMLNGIGSQNHDLVRITEPGRSRKPWTIWEIHRKGNEEDWVSTKGKVYPCQSYLMEDFKDLTWDENGELKISADFTEYLYLPSEVRNMAFIRLAETSLQKGEIVLEPLAVLGLFSNTESISREKLKLGLIVLPMISRFIGRHFDNDSLTAQIAKRDKVADAEKVRHGFPRFLDELKTCALSPGAKGASESYVHLLHKMLFFGSRMSTYLAEIENIRSNEKRFNYSNLKPETKKVIISNSYSLSEVFEVIRKVYIDIISAPLGETTASKSSDIKFFKPRYEVDERCRVELIQPLFDVILVELIYNAKNQADPSKSYFMEVIFTRDKWGVYYITFANNCILQDQRFIKKINKLNSNNKRGLGMVNSIVMTMFDIPIKVSYKDKDKHSNHEFSVTLPLYMSNIDHHES